VDSSGDGGVIIEGADPDPIEGDYDEVQRKLR
jgi:hypothetical protein